MVRPPACDRARTWLSLGLDGELSELERALLDAHLSRCDSCRAAAAAMTAVTEAIRAAPLEPPAVPPVAPRAVRRGGARTFTTVAAAIVAAVVTATGLASVGAIHVLDRSAAAPKLHRVSAAASGMSDDLELLARVRVLRNERPLPGRIVWPA